MEIDNIAPNISGLAVDIDETLSATITHWVEQMQNKFGNPEGLTSKEVVEKYRYAQNVPYWQHDEALKWVDEQIHSNESQEALPLIEGSDLYLNRINKIIPVAAYITVRPRRVVEGTKNWLDKHGFPSAPIICRPEEVSHSSGNEWKAKVLEGLYPQIVGIIDDNAKLLQCLSRDYPGKVFLYDHKDNLGYPFAVACKEWEEVYEKVNRFIEV
ncbi:MAG: 5' nucleotidase, NT5C type [Bacillota bacterium]